MPKTQLLSKSCVLGLTKRNFRPDFFQKALFGLKMWKQTGTKFEMEPSSKVPILQNANSQNTHYAKQIKV